MHLFIWVLSLVTLGALASRSPLWPQPAHVQLGNETLWLDYPFSVDVHCDGHQYSAWSMPARGHRSMLFCKMKHTVLRSLASVQHVLGLNIPQYLDASISSSQGLSEDQILRSAVDRTLSSIDQESFVPWKFYKRHSQFEPESTDAGSPFNGLSISQRYCPSESFRPDIFFDGDESYELFIEHSVARVRTNSTLGTLRALQSLRQLFYAHSSGGVYTSFVPVHILDLPKWPHRGLSLDIARNAFLPEHVMKTIDGMATSKLSRLHLHATDSQSWPIDIPSLPDLAKKGAYQPDLVWSSDDLATVQDYGVHQGVMVFLELDMPGHTASIAHAYPDLIAAFNEKDWSTFAAEPQSGQLKLNSEKVRAFLDTLFEDLLPRLDSYSTLYHFGGDEFNLQVHLLDETVQSNDTKVLKPLVQKVLDQVLGHVDRYGLRPIVWEEMVLDWDLDISRPRLGGQQEKMLVQVWRDPMRIEEVLKKGHSVIFGDFKHWYLDCGFGQFLDPFPSGSSPPGVPVNTSGGIPSRLDATFLDYCTPMKNWRRVYTFNPLEGVDERLHKGIEGGEVLMWNEQTDPVDLDFKLWPRAAAAAEVLWSGPREWNHIADATWRLGQFRERLVLDHGIASSPVQMTWCLMEGGCEY